MFPPLTVDEAIAEGVAPLLARTAYVDGLEPSDRARLIDHVRAGAVHSAALDADLRRLLSALHASGLRPIVIKGAHLAHALYADPALRPRLDTDLLIAPDARQAFAEALEANGYSKARLTSGSIILGQFLYQKMLGPGTVHYVDVHWRAVAPLVFGDAFDADAIARAGVPIPALGPHARGPAPADALALACVHLVAHHWPGVALRWLHDLRLLADSLDDEARERFARGASAGKYRAVAIAALDRARMIFPAVSIDRAIAALQRMPAGPERSAALARPRRLPIQDFLLDLRVAGWRRGPTLVKEHLLPPAEYMRMAFGDRPLPIAYAARLIRAAKRRIAG